MEAGGGRIHAIWLPSENLKLDFTIGYDYNDEGGYPYYYTGAIDGYDKENEKYKNYIGKISYDQDCTYRRGLFNTGSVSYTHLDVYKRQVRKRVSRRNTYTILNPEGSLLWMWTL